MAKKSHPEKGLPSVTIEGIGTLKWNNEQTRLFEEWALGFLDFPKSGIKNTPSGIMTMSAQFAVMNMLQTATMQTRALWHALRTEQPDLKIEDVDNLITEYKQSGKSWDDLLIAIQRSFLICNDPSSLASQEARWKASREMQELQQKILEKTEKKKMSDAREAMANLTTQLQELDSGEAPPDSATVSD